MTNGKSSVFIYFENWEIEVEIEAPLLFFQPIPSCCFRYQYPFPFSYPTPFTTHIAMICHATPCHVMMSHTIPSFLFILERIIQMRSYCPRPLWIQRHITPHHTNRILSRNIFCHDQIFVVTIRSKALYS